MELYKTFFKYSKNTSLRVYFGNEKEHIDLLKSEIFEGIDVFISTPKIMHKLLLLESINTTQIKLFNIDDADYLTKKTNAPDILSITQSIHKCQFVMYSEKMHPTLKRFEEYFMKHARTITT